MNQQEHSNQEANLPEEKLKDNDEQECESTASERTLQEREEDERRALASVFAATRKASAQSRLMTRETWEELDVAPHLEAAQFEALLYSYIRDHASQSTQDHPDTPSTPVYRTATTTVGIPSRSSDKLAEEKTTPSPEDMLQGERATPPEDVPHTDEADTAEDMTLPEGYMLKTIEGQPTLVPVEEHSDTTEDIPCADIEVLVGRKDTYLYSRDYMSQQYAHWAFLAQEDDRVITLVDCAREESRMYPRPLALKSLTNPPFSFAEEEINESWETLSQLDQYADISRTVASNGAVYFYSTTYLSHGYAASLAEWDAVEKAYSV